MWFGSGHRLWHATMIHTFAIPVSKIESDDVATHRNSRTIAIEHRPIEAFYMPNMIMIFRVADPSLLISLTAGDKIHFKVEHEGRSYRIANSN